MENFAILLAVGAVLLVTVAVMSPGLRFFIGSAQNGATYTEGLLWASVLPIVAIAVLGYLLSLTKPEGS